MGSNADIAGMLVDFLAISASVLAVVISAQQLIAGGRKATAWRPRLLALAFGIGVMPAVVSTVRVASGYWSPQRLAECVTCAAFASTGLAALALSVTALVAWRARRTRSEPNPRTGEPAPGAGR